MSTTDTLSDLPPTSDSGAGSGSGAGVDPDRRLRRSRSGRVGAGVAAGLGDYFGLDPVLFRVLFATSAFFGGAGVIAYLLAWVAIPEEGTERAAVDGWIGELRRRHVPPWLVAVVVGLVIWVTAFSWWAPGPFLPVLVVVALVVGVSGRRTSPDRGSGAPVNAQGAAASRPSVDLTKAASGAPTPGASTLSGGRDPAWVGEARAWLSEQREAARERRRRAFPVRMATLAALVAALIVIGTIDAVHGVPLPLYFVVIAGGVVVALLMGMILRRTPWSLTGLLVPSVVGLAAFAGSGASLHDGMGQHEWRPTSSPASSYRLAFGQGVLDLRTLAAQDAPRTVRITMGAGQVKVIAPQSLRMTVRAAVHIGSVSVDGHRVRDGDDDREDGGFNYNRTVDPPAGATGTPLTVIVHLADGNIDIVRR